MSAFGGARHPVPQAMMLRLDWPNEKSPTIINGTSKPATVKMAQ